LTSVGRRVILVEASGKKTPRATSRQDAKGVSMAYTMLDWTREMLRETFEGGRPDVKGTIYLDHDSGIRSTLGKLTAESSPSRPRPSRRTAPGWAHLAYHLGAIRQLVHDV
jgi:hypothetical protein